MCLDGVVGFGNGEFGVWVWLVLLGLLELVGLETEEVLDEGTWL